MSDSSPSVWKGLFWLLLIALIGVYALYNHYADVLKAQLAESRGEVKALTADAAGTGAAPVQAATDEAVTSEDLKARLATAEQRIAALETELTEARTSAAALSERLAQAQADREAAAREAAAEVRAFYEGFADLGARFTDRGILLTLAGDALRFPSGAATLPDQDLPALDRIAELLAERPALSARIEGHTDSSGSAAINQTLSEQRAEAVRAALIERGIAADRLSAVGVGPDRPVADNSTAAGREQNRRVEIVLVQSTAG